MRSPSRWSVGLALMLWWSGAVCADEWRPLEQPNLAAQLEAAAPLATEDLGPAATGVTTWTFMMVPNRDGKTWDALQWYFRGYGGPTWLYACDLGTGVIRKQRFPDGVQIHMCGSAFGHDGRLYITTTGRGGMLLFVYDPDTETLEDRGVIVPRLSGMTRPILLAPDGKFYGAGNYSRPNKAGLYSYDPRTREVREYGALGPDHAPNSAFGYWLGVDETHAYIASGKLPWYLVAVDLQSGAEKILAEAPNGDYPYRMRIWPRNRGALAWVYDQGGDGNNAEYEGGTWYWLKNGAATPVGRELTWQEARAIATPWDDGPSPWDAAGPRPEIYRGQVYPDADGVARLWYRSAEDAAKAPAEPPKDAKPEELGWRLMLLKDVEVYPLRVHLLLPVSETLLFGTAQAYTGRFLYDLAAQKAIPLGAGGPSFYALAQAGDGKVYLSGYSNAPIVVFDPARPWTLQKGGPPGQPEPEFASPASNPQDLGTVYEYTRVKKMHSAAVGADGMVYFGGAGARDYTGGGLGWYDPKTGERGGLWRPFTAYRIFWVTPLMDGKYLALSTKRSEDEFNKNLEPESARVFLFDVATKQVVHGFVAVEKCEKAGPLLEVAPGRCLGITDDPADARRGLLYGVDMMRGEVLFQKPVPAALRFPWTEGTVAWDFRRGPDGCVYTYLGNVLVRIHPQDAQVDVLGKVEPVGRMAFIGNDLYLTGEFSVRRIRDVTSR